MSSPDAPARDWVIVARITSTRGNRGEVRAEILTDFPERFLGVERLLVRERARAGEAARVVEREVEETWFHQGRLIVKFAGVGSIGEAEELVGGEVVVGPEEVMPLPEGTYYRHDLVGLEVFDSLNRRIGRIEDILPTAGVDLLVVHGEQGEILIPIAREFLREVDVAGRKAIVHLPDDLRDLNRS